MAVVEIASRSLTAPKHDAGRLVMLSCLITVVLTVANVSTIVLKARRAARIDL